jgi:hypothetical protein
VNWYSWLKLHGRWQRATGPHETLGEAAKALDRELERRCLRVCSRNQAFTTGRMPRDLNHEPAAPSAAESEQAP